MNKVAKALLADSNGHILVLRRSATHPTLAFHLDLPGGEVEDGESALDAVVREIEEEAGLTLDKTALELIHERQLENELHVVYRAQLGEVRPKVTISWEHDQYEWLPAHELLTRPLPAHADSYYLTVLELLPSMLPAAS